MRNVQPCQIKPVLLVDLIYPTIIFLHRTFMHLLRHHLDFGTRATPNLLVSRLCHTPSVQPFSSRSWSGGSQVAPVILLRSHILRLVLGIPGHLTARCAIKSLQRVLGLPQVSDYFESSSTRRRPGGSGHFNLLQMVHFNAKR